MIAFVIVSSVTVFVVAGVGVKQLLDDFVERQEGGEPAFNDREESGGEVRSQFAWQSRSHFQERD